MIITKSKLKTLIEQYLIEQEDEASDDAQNNPDQEDQEKTVKDKIKSFEEIDFDIDEVKVNIGENDGGLCLTVAIPGREAEVYPTGTGVLKPEDIEEKNDDYIDFILKVSQFLAGLGRIDAEKAESSYEKLVSVLGVFDDAVNHPQSKIAFDKHYVLRKPTIS